MALFKRGRTWWIRFTTPGGKRIRRSAGTSNKAEAQEYHDKLKAETWRVEQLGEKATRTWDDAHLSPAQFAGEAKSIARLLRGHETRVFTYRGKPVKWVNTKAWREALQQAGIAKGFRWHSLRHTWASWLA